MISILRYNLKPICRWVCIDIEIELRTKQKKKQKREENTRKQTKRNALRYFYTTNVTNDEWKGKEIGNRVQSVEKNEWKGI